MHRADGRLYISSPECISLSLSLTLSLRCTCSPSKTAPGPVGEVTVRLWLSREFSGFLRAFSQSVASRDSRFLVLDVYSTPRVSLPRRYRQAPSNRSSPSFPSLFVYFLCRKQCRDLMLCGTDVFRASRNTTRINRSPICRYAWSTCVHTRATLIFRK